LSFPVRRRSSHRHFSVVRFPLPHGLLAAGTPPWPVFPAAGSRAAAAPTLSDTLSQKIHGIVTAPTRALPKMAS